MPDRRLFWLAVALSLACALFLFWGLKGRIWFILELRVAKLSALLLVGASIGVATVLFQTISANRILTPSIMGFDALYILLQTSLVFAFGGLGYASLPPLPTFLGEAGLMMAAAAILFGALLRRFRHDVQILILVGVIFGLMFRSITSFLQRMIDPSEFAIVQGTFFATFGAVGRTELAIAAVIFVVALMATVRLSPSLDVASLGRGPAVSLGLDYDRVQFWTLIIVAAFVSVSTALVGPITFLGLLVASFAHSLMKSHRHALLLPAAALIAALVLVLGQAMFERVFRLQSTLSILIEFTGGLFFLYLVARGRVR